MRRLRSFAYHEPASLDEAVEILGAAGGAARALAGGTDLVVDMKTARLRPSEVVNLKGIAGLAGIEELKGGTRIGALTRVADIERSSLVRRRLPALAAAAGVLATPPVRALATIGGNIGRASPAADLAPPLIVYRAVATIEGRAGARDEPVENLYVGPGVTALAADEIITSILIPHPPLRFGATHLKLGARAGGTDIAMVGVCAGVGLTDGGVIAEAAVALASVAPVPMRARAAEEALLGRGPSEDVVAEAADAAAAESRPISDLRTSAAHRRALVPVLTRRALRAAVAAAGGDS